MKLFITETKLATMQMPLTKYSVEQRFADGSTPVKFTLNHWKHSTQKSVATYLKAFKALFTKEPVENWEDFSSTLKNKMAEDRYFVQQK